MKKSQKLSLIDAVQIRLAQQPHSLIRGFDISLIVHELYSTKKVGNRRMRIALDTPPEGKPQQIINELVKRKLISKPKNLSHRGIFELPGKEVSSEELICFMDPLCYLSHLSAMEIHGLTNRMAKTVFITSPIHKVWKPLIDQMTTKYIHDTPFSETIDHFPFAWHNLKGPIKRKPLQILNSQAWSKENYISLDTLRVSTVGRTFLDMIIRPELCGGIHHVLEVYEEHAKRYKNQILKEANAHANKLQKSRVGYIFEEILGIKDNPTIDAWASSAVQRGGSRKLDAQAPFAPEYSERWCLSLNI